MIYYKIGKNIFVSYTEFTGGNYMKVYVVVLDGFGVGEAPDAKEYGDEGSNSFINTDNLKKFDIPNLTKMGLYSIDGIEKYNGDVIGTYGKLQELSKGKDTTTGHYEIAGIILEKPYPVYNKGIPADLLEKIEKEIGKEVIAYPSISGTEVIKIEGQRHLKTKKPILYTSDDSVIQMACHTDIYSLEELYAMCEKMRAILVGKYEVGRVIARPFATNENGDFYRLPYRRDYALNPPKKSNLEVMQENGIKTLGIGKIGSIFNDVGIDENLPAKNNQQSFEQLMVSADMDFDGFVFANFIDTDMLYGHRNDVDGYRKCVEEFDRNLPRFLAKMKDDDILIITGDHGNDPTTPSVSHSREYTPFLCYGKNVKANNNIGIQKGFNFISEFALEYLGAKKDKKISKLILEK